jgi:predicted MFS family arabinose efflux permease
VGGWIVDALDWRWVFWVNVPFGVIGTVIAWLIIPQTSAAKPGFAHHPEPASVVS